MNSCFILTTRDQKCPNAQCSRYGERGAGNVVIHSQKWKRLQCTRCKKSWVAHRFAVRYRLRATPETLERAGEWLLLGLSIRHTAHRLHVSPGTVLRWKKKFNSISNILNLTS